MELVNPQMNLRPYQSSNALASPNLKSVINCVSRYDIRARFLLSESMRPNAYLITNQRVHVRPSVAVVLSVLILRLSSREHVWQEGWHRRKAKEIKKSPKYLTKALIKKHFGMGLWGGGSEESLSSWMILNTSILLTSQILNDCGRQETERAGEGGWGGL